MALHKQIIQEDGVPTTYHRIEYITMTTNKQNSIAVFSYVDAASRTKEKTDIMAPYTKSVTYETDYDPNMDIESAYQYLKSLPEFENAEDI